KRRHGRQSSFDGMTAQGKTQPGGSLHIHREQTAGQQNHHNPIPNTIPFPSFNLTIKNNRLYLVFSTLTGEIDKLVQYHLNTC
ncbi:MAG TPA: hypothetical protein VF774_12720, partial [Pseudoduganella sp.]